MGPLRVRSQPAADRTRAQSFPMGADLDTWSFGYQIASAEGTPSVLRNPGSLGWGGLYNTHFFIDGSMGIGVLVLMQVLPFYDDSAMEVFRRFEKAVYEALR
jgi:CubicO group peptidase (beta-lactamase class C family)